MSSTTRGLCPAARAPYLFQSSTNYLSGRRGRKESKMVKHLHYISNISLMKFNSRSRIVGFRVHASSVNFTELVQAGNVRTISPKEALSAVNSEGFKLLDIRPDWEREKAHVVGSLHVPLFVKDTENSLVSFLRKYVHFGYIGLWTGQYLTTINEDFLNQVQFLVPDKNSKLLVACGEGLRSMNAISRLYDGGYSNLAWLVGAFNRAADDDFPVVEGSTKLQYATIGGVSYYFLQLLLLFQSFGAKI